MTDELQSVRKVMELVRSGMTFRDAYREISKVYKPDQDKPNPSVV
jgi:argininosuccinate lyase